MKLILESDGRTQKYDCINIRLDYAIFKPKRRSEQVLKIEQKDKIIIFKMSEIDYFKVQE